MGSIFPPIFIEFSPTDVCNQRCPYCYTQYLGHEWLEIPRELLLRIMKDLGDAGVKSVQIQGTGEPLVNEATPDAIVTAKKSGVDVALCTNGVLMDPEISDNCLSSISWYRVSAIESNAELYSKTHGCSESQYHRLIRNLEYAVKLRERDKLETVLAASFIPFRYNA